MPNSRRICRDIHGSCSAEAGQLPSFRPPRTTRSACCSRASRRPQIAKPGMPAEQRADDRIGGQRLEQSGKLRGRAKAESRARHRSAHGRSVPLLRPRPHAKGALRRFPSPSRQAARKPRHALPQDATAIRNRRARAPGASRGKPRAGLQTSPNRPSRRREQPEDQQSPGRGEVLGSPVRADARDRGMRPEASPPEASGCFSAASNGTGASWLAARSRTRRRKTPGGVRFSGRPAESSMSMSQRRSSDATRRASARSGVTRAAVAPGVSSLRRSRSAMVTASCCALTQSYRVNPSRVSARCAGRRRHASVVTAGRSASAISRTRRAIASPLCSARQREANKGRSERPSKPRAGIGPGRLGGQSRTSAGVSSSARSNPAMRCCG